MERSRASDTEKSANSKAKNRNRGVSSDDLPSVRRNVEARVPRDISSKNLNKLQPSESKKPLPPVPKKDFASTSATNSEPSKSPWWHLCYNKQKRTCCGRTCMDWIRILVYSVMYLIFLSTYTMVFLYIALSLVKVSGQPKTSTYSLRSSEVGLTATPTSEHNYPLIWLRLGDKNTVQPYVASLDGLLDKGRQKRAISELGPCGVRPYGYGESPCVVVRVNKQIAWTARPVRPGSLMAKSAPVEVQKLLKLKKQMLWLHCNGYYPWDQEHIGEIKYYPDPPGFDPDLFPLNMSSSSPLIALQLTKFTLGISLSIECKLWYDQGPSSFHFVLYVEPELTRKNYNADFT